MFVSTRRRRLCVIVGVVLVFIVSLDLILNIGGIYNAADKRSIDGNSLDHSVDSSTLTALSSSISLSSESPSSPELYLNQSKTSAKKRRMTSSLTRIGSNLTVTNCPTEPAQQQQQPGITETCPQVLIIGARKGGTTSLYQYLSTHPDFNGIRLDRGPMTGETWYFSSQFSITGIKSYLDLFNESNGRMTGEATVDYLVNCNVPQRVIKVCKVLPKIIILLRDPVFRFLSNFHMRIALIRLQGKNNDSSYLNFDETRSISSVVNEEIREFKSHLKQANLLLNDIEKNWQKANCLFKQAKNMVHEGAYYVHLQNWLCSYPRNKIMIINSEQFFSSPQVVMNEVLQFLDLKSMNFSSTTAVVHNKGMYSSAARHQLHSYAKNKLSQLYQPFNQALIKLLEWDELQWT